MKPRISCSWLTIALAALLVAPALRPALKTAQEAPSSTVDLKSGVVHWTAKRSSGRPRFFDVFGAQAGVVVPADASLPFGRSVAFLVGVSVYDHWDPLPGARETVAQLRDYLLSDGGFDEVYELLDENASPTIVRDLMRNHFPDLKREDRLLFYFGGHGTDRNGTTGYLVFKRGAQTRLDDHHLPTIEILEWSKLIPARHILFLLDACSAGFGLERTPMGGAPGEVSMVTALSELPSREIVTAGIDRQETFDVPGPDGRSITVFGEALLWALRHSQASAPDRGLITLDQVFADLTLQEVSYANRHRVELKPGRFPLVRKGQFVFLNPAARGLPPTADLSARLKLVGTPAATPAPGITGWRQVAIELDDQRRHGSEYVVNLGAISPTSASTLNLDVVNLERSARTVSIRVEGNGLEAEFEGGIWSRAIEGERKARLRIAVSADSNSSSRIIAVNGQQDLFSIGFERQTQAPIVPRQADSRPLPSGPASLFSSPYPLCLGPAPPGYTLVKGSERFWLTGDRACGNWATCEWIRVDDNDVCFSFRLQGHSEIRKNDGIRLSEGHVRAEYQLLASRPTLRVISTLSLNRESTPPPRRVASYGPDDPVPTFGCQLQIHQDDALLSGGYEQGGVVHFRVGYSPDVEPLQKQAFKMGMEMWNRHSKATGFFFEEPTTVAGPVDFRLWHGAPRHMRNWEEVEKTGCAGYWSYGSIIWYSPDAMNWVKDELDIQAAARLYAHELGHALNVAHTDRIPSLMRQGSSTEGCREQARTSPLDIPANDLRDVRICGHGVRAKARQLRR